MTPEGRDGPGLPGLQTGGGEGEKGTEDQRRRRRRGGVSDLHLCRHRWGRMTDYRVMSEERQPARSSPFSNSPKQAKKKKRKRGSSICQAVAALSRCAAVPPYCRTAVPVTLPSTLRMCATADRLRRGRPPVPRDSRGKLQRHVCSMACFDFSFLVCSILSLVFFIQCTWNIHATCGTRRFSCSCGCCYIENTSCCREGQQKQKDCQSTKG